MRPGSSWLFLGRASLLCCPFRAAGNLFLDILLKKRAQNNQKNTSFPGVFLSASLLSSHFPWAWVCFLGHDTQQLSLYLQLLFLHASMGICCIHSCCTGGIRRPELPPAPGERPQEASSYRSYPKCHSTREAILLTLANGGAGPWGAAGACAGPSSTSICSIRKHQFSFYRKAGYPGAEEMFPLPGRMFAGSPERGMYRNLLMRLYLCGDFNKYLPANSLN